MSGAKAETWIRAGYEILSTEGINGIKIERLARNMRLNKSGFYYYFGGMKSYMKSLLEHHIHTAGEVAKGISACENIDPDLLLLVIKHKTFFLVESELVLKSKSQHDIHISSESAKIINQQLLQLWQKKSASPAETQVALAYLDIACRFFYSYIHAENINYEFLHTLVTETRNILHKVVRAEPSANA